MGMAFAPIWLRQMSPPPPASRDHFNHSALNDWLEKKLIWGCLTVARGSSP